jgi:hypothetical protein
LAARGLRSWLQPGLTRGSLHEARWGHSLAALCAANLQKVVRALALKALAGSAIPPPGRPQAPTPLARSGAEAGEPQRARAPRPAYGHSKAGRADLTQGLLPLGVLARAGGPCVSGVRAGHRRDRVDTPRAMAEGLAGAGKGGGGSGRLVRRLVARHGGCASHAVGA